MRSVSYSKGMAVRKTPLTKNPYASALMLLNAQGLTELAGKVDSLYQQAQTAAQGGHISPTRETLLIWRKAKRAIHDAPFIEKDEAEAISQWIFQLGIAVSSVSKAQENQRRTALRQGRERARDIVAAGGNPKAKVLLPERESALVQLLERVL